MNPLAIPTIEEINRYNDYKKFKSVEERILPFQKESADTSYGFNYPLTDEEIKDLERVITNYDLVFIKDNVFNNEQIEILDNHAWTQQQHGSWQSWLEKDDVNNLQFKERLKQASNTITNCPLLEFLVTDTMNAVLELDPSAEFTYFHGTYYTVQNAIHVGDQIHRDFHRVMAGWTCLYHLTGQSGPTLFFDNYFNDPNKKPSKVVDFKQGRRILFPGYYSHRADIPVPGDTRAIAVVRFQIKTVLNEQIFAKTPGLENKYDLNNINQ